MKVPIVYAVVDQDLANKLCDALRAEGIDASLDEDLMGPGSTLLDLERAVSASIRRACLVVLLLTEALLRSPVARGDLRKVVELRKNVFVVAPRPGVRVPLD